MAQFSPLVLESGSFKLAGSGSILNYINFPLTKLYAPSSAYMTALPDPYYFQTSSADVETLSDAVSASVLVFAPQVTPEYQVFAINAILGVRTTTLTGALNGAGVRIGLQTANAQDRSVVQKVASTLTGFTYLNQGSEDAFAFVTPTSIPNTNTTYPAYIQGVLGMPSASFNNVILVQSREPGASAIVASGSLVYNQFIGYSSSLARITSSYGPLVLTSSNVGSRLDAVGSGDVLAQAALPLTASGWQKQVLGTAVSVTSNVAYSNLFTLTGLTAGTRYLVNFYLIASSAAATTGVQVRFISGSTDCRGTFSTPVSATAYSIQNSEGGNNITNLATAWPTANAKALVWGEFTFVKSGSVVPALQLKSEINASAVRAETGSVIFYRALQ